MTDSSVGTATGPCQTCGGRRRILDPDSGWRWADCPECALCVVRAIAEDGTETELEPVYPTAAAARSAAVRLAGRSLWGRVRDYIVGLEVLPRRTVGVGVYRRVMRATAVAPHGWLCVSVIPVGHPAPEPLTQAA